MLGLIDQNRPDLVYTDGGAFDGVGLEAIAHYYKANVEWHKGSLEGVYTLKDHRASGPEKFGDYQEGASALDVERGAVGEIRKDPFQTDTCIGQWFYWEGFDYKPAKEVAHRLLDIVSKNGNLLLSIPLLPDGTLDSREESILEDFTAWIAIHGPGIFGSRPWKTYGEGPTYVRTGQMSERDMKLITAEDLRFTTQGDKLYCYCLGWPDGDVRIRSLWRNSVTGLSGRWKTARCVSGGRSVGCRRSRWASRSVERGRRGEECASNGTGALETWRNFDSGQWFSGADLGLGCKRVHTSGGRCMAGGLGAAETDAARGEERRLKAGCSQDWLPHNKRRKAGRPACV